MKTLTIAFDDELFAEIDKRTTSDFDHSDVVQKLLKKALASSQQVSTSEAKRPPPLVLPTRNSVASFVQTSEYKVLSGINKYLAVLGWLHKNKPDEFGKIESYRRGNRVYFGKSQRQVEESGDGVSAKQIPGSNVWALATLDNRAKRGLLADVLQLLNLEPGEINIVIDSIPDSGRHRRDNIFDTFNSNS